MRWVYAGQAVFSLAGRCSSPLSQTGTILDLTRCPSSDPPLFSKVFITFLAFFESLRWLFLIIQFLALTFFPICLFCWLSFISIYKNFFLPKSRSLGFAKILPRTWQSQDKSQATVKWTSKVWAMSYSSPLWWFNFFGSLMPLTPLGSGIKLSLHLHLCLLGCSRVWSLNGSTQI